MAQYLDFEQPIALLDHKIEELRKTTDTSGVNITEEIRKLKQKSQKLTLKIFSSLTDWQIIQLARHFDRPHTEDYLQSVFCEFQELHGDRQFGDDPAMIGGLARLEGHPVVVIGQEKGRDTKQKVWRNFGMPHPEGYRKALRLMKLAEQFQLPVVTLIDTPGAYPGVQAEMRGQSEAIARNLREMAGLRTPIISVVIGEGCSGGALGIGVSDTMLMLEYSYFATISPEGCASILWKTADKAPEAAAIMGIIAPRLRELGLIDEVIKEPIGGAHRDAAEAANYLKTALVSQLKRLDRLSLPELLERRYERLMSFGRFSVKVS